MTLKSIEINTRVNPDCAVIWLHGLGASGHDFEPIVNQLQLPDTSAVRFIFPHAPIQAVSLNAGMRMPAWYDLHGLSMGSKEDQHGIEKITLEIHALIKQQIVFGIPANKIVLAGFSQGGALSLYAGLTNPEPIAGIMALSCYLPLREQFNQYSSNASRNIEIFMAHGKYDDVVAMDFAKLAKQKLGSEGFQIQWHEYPCGHTICAEEIQDIQKWLLSCWD